MANNTNGQAGKMVYLPGGLKVCQDCMQKTLDMASTMDFSSLMGNPFLRSMTPNEPKKDIEPEKKKDQIIEEEKKEEPVSGEIVKKKEPEKPETVQDQDDEEDAGTSQGGGDGRVGIRAGGGHNMNRKG